MHTREPWEVYNDWYIRQTGQSGCHAEVKCSDSVPSSNVEEHKANAQLIAAAPELLAVCKAVVEEDGFRGSHLMRKRIDAMKAAIAKAEGRS